MQYCNFLLLPSSRNCSMVLSIHNCEEWLHKLLFTQDFIPMTNSRVQKLWWVPLICPKGKCRMQCYFCNCLNYAKKFTMCKQYLKTMGKDILQWKLAIVNVYMKKVYISITMFCIYILQDHFSNSLICLHELIHLLTNIWHIYNNPNNNLTFLFILIVQTQCLKSKKLLHLSCSTGG